MKKAIYSRNLYKKRNDEVAIELSRKLNGKQPTHENIENALWELDYGIYKQIKEQVSVYYRITLPFFAICWIVLFVLMPIAFLINGDWGYDLPRFQNWAKKLGF